MANNETLSRLKATPVTDLAQPLTAAQIGCWQKEGAVLVSNLFPDNDVNFLHQAASDRFPQPGTLNADETQDFGSAGAMNFPSELAEFNNIVLNPRLLQAVAALLEVKVSELRLSQADLWPKYGRAQKPGTSLDNSDQRIHVDYPNHSLAHPTPWSRPEAVEMMLYLSDGKTCGGGTAYVARRGDSDPAYRWPIVDSPGIGILDYVNDRTKAEEYLARVKPQISTFRSLLYERETQIDYDFGDLLLYRHDTWHRGNPVNPGTCRFALNVTYRKASAEWISTLHIGWAWSAYHKSKFLERLIATCTLDQRAVLGFPQPQSDYWCDETLAGVAARYGALGMDMRPYTQAHKMRNRQP